MIAEVYPIKRMPRRFSVFDYRIPDEIQLSRGDLVKISFRKTKLLGIVAHVKDKPPRGIQLKNIDAKHEALTLREEELSFFEWLAHDLAQSVPAILHAALPSPPLRGRSNPKHLFGAPLTITSDDVHQIVLAVQEMSRRRTAFVHASDLRRSAVLMAKFMEKNKDQKCLIIAPTVRDVKLLARYLSDYAEGYLSGEETNNERFQTWQQFRAKTSGCLIGTKLALLLIDPLVSTIFLVRSGHANHKQFDRNPRYDARLLAQHASEVLQTNLFFLDVLPRVDDLATFATMNIVGRPPSTPVVLVDRQKELQASPHPVFSYTVATAIADMLDDGKRVLCVYNKKGLAQRLSCEDCQHAFPCTSCQNLLRVDTHTVHCARCGFVEPLPLNCPKCKSIKILHKGYGNERVAAVLSQLFPNASIAIVDKDHPTQSTAHIQLVTQYYLENIFNPFVQTTIGLVVLLDADSPLFDKSFRALEKTFLQSETWRGVAHANKAKFIIQTDSPELFQEELQDPQTFFEQELQNRRSFGHPPKRRWIRIQFEDDEPRKSQLKAEVLVKKIEALDIEAEIIGPRFESTTKWIMDIAVDRQRSDMLLKFFTSLDDQYIIDTHAFSC